MNNVLLQNTITYTSAGQGKINTSNPRNEGRHRFYV